MKSASLPSLALAAMVGGHFASASGASAQFDEAPETLDCAVLDCAAVLPGASRFEQPEGQVFATGYGDGEDPVGWVALSTDIVDVPAYSGKPLVTLVGLGPDGVITGARVVHHSEPILLVGIPEEKLHDFARFYVGQRADARIVVGTAHDEESIAVDVISGATVTALAQNRTILEATRKVGAAVGVVDLAQVGSGHFIEEEVPWTWQRMTEEAVFGRLTVSEADMGVGDGEDAFVDLWFTIADAPQVGRPLLGDGTYTHLMEQLEPGQHLFVVLGMGSNSFKGSAFVRGGIFDRVRVEQGLTELVFRDTDYTNLGRLNADDAPRFKEGAVFITRGASLDPGRPFSLVFLGSRYDGRGGFTRDFREFSAEHRLPESVYLPDESADEAIWVQAWRNRKVDAIVLGIFLLFVVMIFVGRKFTTADSKRLKWLHMSTMVVSFLGMGVYLKAQPSVTQILTFLEAVVFEWRIDLFASEPLIFVAWIFIFVVSVIWGRGVFCGWVCPYGSASELLFAIGQKFGVKMYELPDKWHNRLRWLRYGVLLGLIPVYFIDSILAEKLAEIEPFKSTFLVPFWTRHWLLIAWWALLVGASIVTFRPFCRYLCPLGAGLAILNSFRVLGPKRRRFCSRCKICARDCEPRAIRSNGTIDPRECLSCMQCEAHYRDVKVCPPLIGIERLTRSGKRDAAAVKKIGKLQTDAKDA